MKFLRNIINGVTFNFFFAYTFFLINMLFKYTDSHLYYRQKVKTFMSNFDVVFFCLIKNIYFKWFFFCSIDSELNSNSKSNFRRSNYSTGWFRLFVSLFCNFLLFLLIVCKFHWISFLLYLFCFLWSYTGPDIDMTILIETK